MTWVKVDMEAPITKASQIPAIYDDSRCCARVTGIRKNGVTNTEWIGSQEFQNRNYDKALYDFRQERLSENLTQNVIRRNR